MITNEFKYKVTTEDREVITINFFEMCDSSDYGNGKTVTVECETSGYIYTLDCRYKRQYNFQTLCENWLKDFYGNKLIRFEVLL